MPQIVIKIAALALAGLLVSATAVADGFDWLVKINQAAAQVNFKGVFVYLHDGEIEAMEVARRIDDGQMQERLYALNGEPREVIRGMDKVWCYIPDQNVVVHDYRQTSGSGFPRILPGDIENLEQNYAFEVGGTARIANRGAQEVRIMPHDSYRYGYSLWADQETGLLLRSDLLDGDGNMVEQYLFVDVEIGGDIADEDLAPVSKTQDLQLFGNAVPVAEPAKAWVSEVSRLPRGYTLSKHIHRVSPMDAGELEHLVFTDGLSTVSVFIKEARAGQSGLHGLSKMGAVHAYRTTVDNYRITVLGEVPADTVEFLASGISVR